MTELTEAEQEKLNKGRMMRAESSMLLPLLETKQTLVLARIVQAFRAGESEKLLSLAAELSTLFEMKGEISRTIKQAQILEEKQYADAE